LANIYIEENSPDIYSFTRESLPPVSIYIHIPWCVRKCPYCDFNSHSIKGDMPEDEYVWALLNDLDQEVQFLQGRNIQSVFIGGGTPSVFSPGALAQLLEGLHRRCRFEPNVEITLEVNPGTVEQKNFADYRALGITRLSVGVQSFNNQHLHRLGRVHCGVEAKRAIGSAIQILISCMGCPIRQ
jgi:coproporphyrinogen III oxidase-like Fe-S oxidoreductase